MRKHGNRYSAGLTLTDREAKTLRGCINKLRVIAAKDGRYIGERNKLFNTIVYMTQIIKDAGREDVL